MFDIGNYLLFKILISFNAVKMMVIRVNFVQNYEITHRLLTSSEPAYFTDLRSTDCPRKNSLNADKLLYGLMTRQQLTVALYCPGEDGRDMLA